MLPGLSSFGRIVSFIETLFKSFQNRSERQKDLHKKLALIPIHLAEISSFCGLNGTLKYASADVDECRKMVVHDRARCLDLIGEMRQVLDGEPRLFRALDKMQELLESAYLAQRQNAGVSDGKANIFAQNLYETQKEIARHLDTVRQHAEAKLLAGKGTPAKQLR